MVKSGWNDETPPKRCLNHEALLMAWKKTDSLLICPMCSLLSSWTQTSSNLQFPFFKYSVARQWAINWSYGWISSRQSSHVSFSWPIASILVMTCAWWNKISSYWLAACHIRCHYLLWSSLCALNWSGNSNGMLVEMLGCCSCTY